MQIRGVLDHHNIEKALASVFISPSDYCLLDYSKLGARYYDSPWLLIIQEQIYSISGSNWNFPRIQVDCSKTGALRVHEKGFGFVGDVNVRSDLVTNIVNETQVTVVALKKPKMKGDLREIGWQVVSLQSVPKNPKGRLNGAH